MKYANSWQKDIIKYKTLMTNLLSFTQRLGNSLRTLNTLSQGRDHPDYRVSIHIELLLFQYSGFGYSNGSPVFRSPFKPQPTFSPGFRMIPSFENLTELSSVFVFLFFLMFLVFKCFLAFGCPVFKCLLQSLLRIRKPFKSGI